MEDVPISQRKAVLYGEVEIIPGILCDGYVLDDGTAVMSERGTAKLLGMERRALYRLATTWPPKILISLLNQELSLATTINVLADKNLSSMQFQAEITASNNYFRGKKITVGVSRLDML